jgi:hypothetical protein
LTWNRVWTPTIVTSFRTGWNYGLFIRDNPSQTNGELLNQKYGIKGGNQNNPGGFSAQNISGYRTVGIGAFNPVDRNSQNHNIVGDLSWAINSHNVKFGANILRSQNNVFNVSHNIGTHTYNARYTGDGMADFMLGMASQWRWHYGINVQLRQKLYGFYVQDDWKISPKLTINLGIRYELLLPWVDKHDRMGIFDITTDPDNPRLIYAGSEGNDTFNRAMYAMDKNNFMPRLGFAYKITESTVLRGGYGVFYTYMEPYGDAQYLIGNPPATYGVTRGSSATAPAVILNEGPPEGATEFENATGITFTSYDRYPKLGSAQQWNVNIQHEFARDWLFEIGYSGSRGTNLLRRYDGNFSPPGPGSIDGKRRYQTAEVPGTGVVLQSLGQLIYYAQDGESNYQALVTRLEKRFSDGFTLLGSYTFSKAVGDTCGNAAAGDAGGCGFQDLTRLYLEKAVDNQHIPHRFTVSSIWELPFGRGRKYGSDMNSVANAIVGGWAIGNILTFTSGRPYNATVNGNPANTGTHGVHNRPDISGDPYDGYGRSVEQDFDTSVFSPNQQYEIGNFPRNGLRQRDQFNWDFSMLKDFTITEDVRMQFRFEAFHFTNTPRFENAGNVVGTGNFGRITGAGTPRNLQFGIKFIW